VDALERAIGPKTRAIVLAHTLGNPFDAIRVAALAEAHGLYLVEDCCDALGATVGGRHVGQFGDLATCSFYPAHHITTGEGGAVLTKRRSLAVLVESFRDWGRDCWCPPGAENTCGNRFNCRFEGLPPDY
ncbi:MAG: DegT/DnrJ/EryC1/StrS family aminotransferase, partial [Alphaproteobacteria bacterium]|nr:DegT/DnrJ/EryC1/StrS family aminotransferase [Alphaproteobacteria bacterium]